MNSDFLKTLDAFDNATSSRRDVIRKAGRFGAGAALAAVPFFAMARSTMAKTYGFNPQEDGDILNFALTLEYLESFFYLTALSADGPTIPSEVRPLFETISAHEAQHVEFLRTTLSNLGITPVTFTADQFDFTGADGMGNGPFDISDYDTFLLLSQAFEDTGVRAYKGQATMIEDPMLLTAALQIHAVEARHAAAVRRVRGVEAWIPFAQSPDPAVDANYAGEDNVTQGDLNLVVALPSYTPEQITEAFDEPLTMADVLALIDGFVDGDQTP